MIARIAFMKMQIALASMALAAICATGSTASESAPPLPALREIGVLCFPQQLATVLEA